MQDTGNTPVSPAITFAQTEESTSGCVSEAPPPETSSDCWTSSQSRVCSPRSYFYFFFFYTLRYSDVYTCWCVCVRERVCMCVSMNVSCDPNVCELIARLFFFFFLMKGLWPRVTRLLHVDHFCDFIIIIIIFLLMENKLDRSSLHNSPCLHHVICSLPPGLFLSHSDSVFPKQSLTKEREREKKWTDDI